MASLNYHLLFPAGMTAALYAKRANLRVALLETNVTGGLVNSTYTVENFPSYPEIHGMKLMENIRGHIDNWASMSKRS